jgi:hypothetical protein
VSGGETEWSVQLQGPFARQPITVAAGYAFLDAVRSSGDVHARYLSTLSDTVGISAAPLQYRYGTDFLRHKATLSVDHSLLLPLRLNWRFRYEARNDANDGALLWDLRAYMSLQRVQLYVSAANLLDARYREIGSIPGPGRTCRAGITTTFSQDTPRRPQRRIRERRWKNHERP